MSALIKFKTAHKCSKICIIIIITIILLYVLLNRYLGFHGFRVYHFMLNFVRHQELFLERSVPVSLFRSSSLMRNVEGLFW